jgi:hypothetical protein
MTPSADHTDDIARVAHAIWEAEGRPEGRDHEHWMRAKQLIAEGRAEAEYPAAAASGDAGSTSASAARPVQPGFEDVPPGIVPEMKDDAGAELREGPGGRFAKQIAEAPEEGVGEPAGSDTPAPRHPEAGLEPRRRPGSAT